MQSSNEQSAEEAIYAWLNLKGFSYEMFEHDATPTVADALRIKGDLPRGHSKSLLLTEKDGSLTLVTLRGEIRADLKKLAKSVGAKRFSFAPEKRMIDVLKVRPGTLSPLALINDLDREIRRVVLDSPLLNEPLIWCHPLRNTASVGLSPEALTEFAKTHGPSPVTCDLEGLPDSC